MPVLGLVQQGARDLASAVRWWCEAATGAGVS